MKHIVFFLSLVAATALAQDTFTHGASRTLPSPKDKERLATLVRVEKPNQIVSGGRTYSGIAVQVVKTDNLLQLINPFAPAKYGSGEDNLVADRDPITGRPAGLSVLTASVGR